VEIKPAEIGEKVLTLKMEHEEAVELVKVSPSEVLNKKLGADRDPYYVIGACNAKIANKALDISPKIGGLFPCNMVVWEEKPGSQTVYHVSIMRIARILGIAPDDEAWQEIIDETGRNVEAVFDELKSR